MLITATGSPFAPAGMLERLHEIDDRLGLVWLPLVGRWALTYDWAYDEPRRILVKKGELGGDCLYDILTFLPPDCGADEAYSYVVRSFKACANTRDDIKKCLERVHLYNRQITNAAKQEVMELADELIAANAPTLFRAEGKTAPRFYMHNPPLKKSKPLVLSDD